VRACHRVALVGTCARAVVVVVEVCVGVGIN